MSPSISCRWRVVVLTATALAISSASARAQQAKPAPWTLVIGLESTRHTTGAAFKEDYTDAVELAGLYIYAHLHGLGGLRVPNAVFVGSIGGERPNEPKSFHPIQDFSGRSPQEISADLRRWFPPTDLNTDFNAFFERVSVHIKRSNLVLAPLDVVIFSDGIPHVAGEAPVPVAERYGRLNLTPLEYLSRSVTLRLLYTTPGVAERWEKGVKRQRVKIWTQDRDIMRGWHRHVRPNAAPDQQDALWTWMRDIVDFRVRRGVL